MINYYNPDLSGTNYAYRTDNDIRTIFKNDQVVKFDTPVFDNNMLVIKKLGIINETLVKNTDYVILPENIDYDMMSRMKTINSGFNKTLISSVTIIHPYTEQYNIKLSYNRLFPDDVSYSLINGVPPVEESEQLLSTIVQQINYLNDVIKNRDCIFTPESTNNVILDEDINGTNPANEISDEEHTVNVPSGILTIKPKYGAFFKDSVVVKDPGGIILQEGVDYSIFGLDLVKTEISSNASGVYNYIKIIKPIIGDITISYHAFGGNPTTDNLKLLENDIISIKQFLSNTPILSPSSLKNDQTILALKNKITSLEDNMRILLNSGIATYGDSTHSVAIRKKIISSDENHHWWTIAELYKVDGSNEIIIADSMRFRVQLMKNDIQFECGIAFNKNSSDNPFSVNCISGNINRDTFYKCTPRIRVIYKNTPQSYSGALLQIGLKIESIYASETIGVEDLSGKESCWKLISVGTDSVPPEDDNIELPDGSTYDASSLDTVELIQPINIPNGFNLNTENTISIPVQSNPITINNKIINPLFYLTRKEVSKIKEITIKLIVNSNNEYYINIPAYPTDNIYANTDIKIGNTVYEIEILQYLSTSNQFSDVDFRISRIYGSGSNSIVLSDYIIKF